MQPLGRKKQRFPHKTKEWFGKGILMWWENSIPPNKTFDKRKAETEIQREIDIVALDSCATTSEEQV